MILIVPGRILEIDENIVSPIMREQYTVDCHLLAHPFVVLHNAISFS